MKQTNKNEMIDKENIGSSQMNTIFFNLDNKEFT